MIDKTLAIMAFMLFSTPPKHPILVDKLAVASSFLSNKTLTIVTAFDYSERRMLPENESDGKFTNLEKT